MNKQHLNCWFTLRGRALVCITNVHLISSSNRNHQTKNNNNALMIGICIDAHSQVAGHIDIAHFMDFDFSAMFGMCPYLSSRGASTKFMFTSQFTKAASRRIITSNPHEKVTIIFAPYTHSSMTQYFGPSVRVLFIFHFSSWKSHILIHSGWVGLCIVPLCILLWSPYAVPCGKFISAQAPRSCWLPPFI